MTEPAFQDLIPDNHCFGCGPDNPHGLRIKSHWASDEEAVCGFRPEPHHNAGPVGYVNGGILATLVDCHGVCTAVADGYRREGRVIGSAPLIWYVTGSLSVTYLRPARIAHRLEVRARVTEVGARRTRVTCTVLSEGEACVRGEVVAIRVPASWRQGHG